MQTIVPAGMVTPLENVNGRNVRRSMETEEAESESASRTWGAEEEIQRTGCETINPLDLPDKTVDLVHLVHSEFRPTFLCNHGVDLLAEELDIFGIRKKTIQHLRKRL